MPTGTELKEQIDTDITDKTTESSVTTDNVGQNLKDVVDYIDQQVTAAVGYSVYEASLTQSGTDAPTVVVNKNTTGLTPAVGRTGVGVYVIVLSSPVPDKTGVFISNGTYSAKRLATSYSISGNNVTIRTWDLATGALSDDMLLNTHVKIEVYP